MKRQMTLLAFLLVLLSLPCESVWAQKGKLQQPFISPLTFGQPARTIIDINNLTSWIKNNGLFEAIVDGASWNGTFPKGTTGCIYQDGIVWGGIVHDGQTPALRVGGTTYRTGLVAGAILSGGVVDDPNAPEVRIYRVRTDYATADLRDDAANFLQKPLDAVTAADIQMLRDQYQKDWSEWPANKGAPFEDKDRNGAYNPAADVPGIPQADQTVWFVANDMNANVTLPLYGSPPIGLEAQYTIWAYNRPGALSDMIFKRMRLIYKGTASTPANARIDSMFIVQWSDPDIGNVSDDFVGCDTSLGLGYAYNADNQDREFDRFGLRPPAVGYEFLQGPIIKAPGNFGIFDFKRRPGLKNLSMTAFATFRTGGTRVDPAFGGTYSGTLQWFNLMRGCEPRPEYPSCTPFRNNLGQITMFELTGDPVTQQGDIDGGLAPGDRRMFLASGPFTMARGDTQEVVVAVVGGLGDNNLDSITKMKANARVAQTAFDNFFQAYPPRLSFTTEFFSAQSSIVRMVAEGREINASTMAATLKKYDNTSVATIALFDDGAHNDGGAGDQVYGNLISVTPQSGGLFLNLDVAYNNGLQATWEHLADDISTAGPVTVPAFAVASDNLNADGIVNPGENIRYGLTLLNRSALINFTNVAVTAQPDPEGKKIELGDLNRLSAVSLHYNAGDPLTYFTFDVPADYQAASFEIAISITDLRHNHWLDTLKFAVTPFSGRLYGTPLTHTGGLSDWSLNVLVVDPNAVTNRSYEITIVDSIDAARHRGFTLKNLASGNLLLQNHALPDSFGHNIPVTDGFKILRGENFGLIGLRQDQTRWMSPNPVWFRGIRFTNDPQSAFNGGVTTGFQLGQSYLGQMASNFDPTLSLLVEVRFDATKPQKAYRLRRTGPATEYLIQDPNPFVDVPFSVWEVTNPGKPRQLTVAWRDQDNDGAWNPPVDADGTEIVFIYFKSYDPTGMQFNLPPAAIPNECTIGAKADIMYGLSLGVRSGHILNESAGVLFISPYIGLSSQDRFTFNPTIVSVHDQETTPVKFSLAQNFPNPFNPATSIRFSIPRRSKVSLKIYNLMGQEVVTLIDQEMEAGFHQVEWRGLNKLKQETTTGVYFYRLEAGDFVEVKKMVLLR